MKLVVDSNCLRDDRLARFLSSSPANLAVLIDYSAMEALKGDALIGMTESMRILARFPRQVQILKTTLIVCGLSGTSKGLQRRLVDFPTTNQFADFCRDLISVRTGSKPLSKQLQNLGVEARAHLDRVEKDAKGFAEASVDMARLFSTEDRHQITSSSNLKLALQDRLLTHVMELSATLFNNHPSVKRLPTSDELINTFIFRSALSHLLLGFKYSSVGGVSAKKPANIRSDMIDSYFATYATFFDGLLSRDLLANSLHSETLIVLNQFRKTYFGNEKL